MLISEAFNMYKNDCMRMRRQSPRTEETHDYVSKNLSAFFKNKTIESLTIEDIRRWVECINKTRSSNTVRGYIIKLRRVLAYCQSRGIAVVDVDLVPVPQRADANPTFLTEEEVSRMISSAPNLRAKFVISLLYSSGIRLAEFTSLNRDQIYQRKFTVTGKGGKVRLCFIDSRTEKLMEQYLEARKDRSNALVVSFQSQERMTRTNVELLVKNAARRAGIVKHVTPHTLRHSYATNFLRNNGNMRYLSAMMGHRSLDTTMMYAHVVDNDLEEQYKKYHST